jgi:hypothetical protein
MTDGGFDELSRKMAGSHSRRGVLKAMGAAVAAGVAGTVLKPFRGDATVGCTAGQSVCGTACCEAGAACANASKNCCCLKGQAVCGDACCIKGVACFDRVNSICGCPKGLTPCPTANGLTCCNAGTACSPSNATCQPVASFSPSTTASTCCKSAGATCTSNGECCSASCLSGSCTGTLSSDVDIKDDIVLVSWER